MQKYQEFSLSRKQIIVNNFLGGLAWGLGATIGVSVFLAILGFFAAKLNLIPIIGSFASNTLGSILQNNKHFH